MSHHYLDIDILKRLDKELIEELQKDFLKHLKDKETNEPNSFKEYLKSVIGIFLSSSFTSKLDNITISYKETESILANEYQHYLKKPTTTKLNFLNETYKSDHKRSEKLFKLMQENSSVKQSDLKVVKNELSKIKTSINNSERKDTLKEIIKDNMLDRFYKLEDVLIEKHYLKKDKTVKNFNKNDFSRFYTYLKQNFFLKNALGLETKLLGIKTLAKLYKIEYGDAFKKYKREKDKKTKQYKDFIIKFKSLE